MKKLLPFLMILIILVQSCDTPGIKIIGNQIIYKNKPVKMWGMRVASASQNDEFTSQLIASLNDYKQSGIRSISVFLQGSSGGFSDPFTADGKSIDKGHLDRFVKIIRECEKLDIIVIAGIFYQRSMTDKSRKLKDRQSVINAVRFVTEKLKPYNNVIINIANEQNSYLYQECSIYNFNDPENIIALCSVVHSTDPKRIAGGGGYNDESNNAIGKSPDVDVLLFDTYSRDVDEGKDSGWKYDYFRSQGVPDKPMINVEIFGGWTQKFIPPGVYPDEGKQIHIREIEAAKKRIGLSVHFHSNPWFQGPSIGEKARFDLGGMGTIEDPGVRWWTSELKK